MSDLSISVVLYQSNIDQLKQLIASVEAISIPYKLYLIDNSPTDKIGDVLKQIIGDKRIQYIFTGKNLGYGAGHNVAIRQTIDETKYHLVLNPDIEFAPGTLESIFAYMQSHSDAGLLMPKVFYKNGALQKLCNPLPKPINLIGRRFFLSTDWAKKINDAYELKEFNYDHCLNVPNLSGCFMFLRCSILKHVGLFDERYFMYMEDVDLCRRIHAVSKTIFYPSISIIHGFEKESYSSKALLKHHIQSAIKYFNKWGWVIDKQRDKFNQKLLTDIVSGNIKCN